MGGGRAAGHAFGDQQGLLGALGGQEPAPALPQRQQLPHPGWLQGLAAAEAPGRGLAQLQMGDGRSHRGPQVHHQGIEAQFAHHPMGDQGRTDARREGRQGVAPLGCRAQQEQFGIGGGGPAARFRRGAGGRYARHGGGFGASQQQQHLGLLPVGGAGAEPGPGAGGLTTEVAGRGRGGRHRA